MASKTSTAGQDVCARRRRKAFRAARVKARMSAFLVSRQEDVGYLTGFTGEDSLCLLGEGWASLITDGRYAEQAAQECGRLDVFIRKGGIPSAVAEVLKRRRIRSLGVQAGHMTLQAHRALAKALGVPRLKAVSNVLDQLRAIKDEGEIRSIRRAIRAAEGAFRQLLAGGVKAWVGRTERELAAELTYRMGLAGADRPSFDTIVAAGAHSSLPHYRPGNHKIRRGEAVLVDWGAMVGGYCSDLTRVVFTGRILPKLAEIYEVVRRAQRAGIVAIRSGAGCKSVDRAARRVIQAAGYGDEFVHSLGHCLGRQVHEKPVLAAMSKARLRAGMVVTVEPGVYLPGVGGVRIEDDVLVTRDGRRRLSTLPRDISAMVLR